VNEAQARALLMAALAALIAVIGAKRARRAPEGRCEARGRPCRHYGHRAKRSGARGRRAERAATLMCDARDRWTTAISARSEPGPRCPRNPALAGIPILILGPYPNGVIPVPTRPH